MKKFSNYHDFFSTVAKCFVLSPNFYSLFIKHGFEPFSWPDCEGRDLAIKFHSMAEERSVEYAKLHCRDEAKKLRKIEIPEESSELIVAFSQFKQFGTWEQAAQRTLENPMLGEEIFFSAKNKNHSKLTARLVQADLNNVVEEIKADIKAGKELVRKVHKWPLLSESLGGFNPGRVYLIVAGTGVGKTTFTLNFGLDVLRTMPALFVNMEMTYKDMIKRLVQIGAELSSRELLEKYNDETEQKVGAFISTFYSHQPLYMTEGEALTLNEIKNMIFRHKQEHNVDFVFVDYDQKIRTNMRGEEWQTVLKAVEELEEVAKKTETSIVILAQGDASGDPKASKRSAQPASAVIALGKETRSDQDGEKEIYFLESKKNRYGPKFKIALDCDFRIFKIKENGIFTPHIPPKQEQGSKKKQINLGAR